MAAFLTFSDRSDLCFHTGESNRKKAMFALIIQKGLHSLYLDCDELERAKEIITSAGLEFKPGENGRSKTFYPRTIGEASIITLILMNW